MATPVGVYSMAEWSIIAPVDDSVMLYCDWLITLAGDWMILGMACLSLNGLYQAR